ncbi:Hsp70 family protein [Streptomyces acidicola]|uniref:Hsp70 family protein n=1 Tax=Streptomyces acidicola TaxID=2596892 RepID=A0A5N8WRC6_9ACTN|nr:Hsp70 family protein [Streptomyces acidicola]MPY48785.1 Hsp70 family protein [Streptomyces acidicola]
MSAPRLVAAIDIGTHGIGAAWCVISESNAEPSSRKIHFCDQWESQPAPTAKNLSALLLGADGKLIAWGYDARRLWLTQGAALRSQGARYHHGFKMDLGARPAPQTSDDGSVNSDSLSVEPADKEREVLKRSTPTDRLTPDLLTMLLREVVAVTLRQIAASGYDEDDISWCLTSPACWSDYQKSVLRGIALDAGLPSEDGRVLLSLEPEAAAHYARVSGVRVVGDQDGPSSDLLAPGARFMVVDCGGGTVDITAYENDTDGKMIEIGRSIGDRFGSDFLNRAFEKEHLRDCLGDQEILDEIQENCPDALLNLVDQWERGKLHVALDQDENLNLLIPTAIDRRLGAAVRKRLARRQNKINDAIVLTPAQIHALFDTVIPGTLDLIEAQLKEMDASREENSNADVILLVGGFSNSPYLQQAVKERFGERAQVMVPPNPDIAVLFGATHFCYDPQTRARRSRFTYGTEVNDDFEEGIDPEAKRYVTSRGQVTCADRFSIFTRAGASVPTNAEVMREYLPLEEDHTEVDFTIYATSHPDPRYVTDPGCDALATVTVDLKPVMRFNLEERALRLFMRFGETEIKARAELVQGGGEIATSVRFHSNY